MNVKPRYETAAEIRPTVGSSHIRPGMKALADFAVDVDQLQNTLHQLEPLTSEGSRKTIHKLRRDLAAFEPSITVLGQVKAGKTALINAIAGWADLLPSDVNPWTSVVTSLHLTPSEERAEIGAKFHFLTEDEWNRLTTKGGRLGELAGRAGAESELKKIQEQIAGMREKSRARLGRHFELLMGQEHEFSYFDKNLLERYICLGDHFDVEEPLDISDEQGRFADITRSAELFLNCQTVPYKLCIRDTPGVNDTFMIREMVTIKAVRESRICVVVLSATQALTSIDMALVRMVSNLQSRDVVIFVNRIDELPDPSNQIVEIEESIRDTLSKFSGPENAEIIFGSAYWATIVLAGKLDTMHESSAESLLSLASSVLGSTMIDQPPSDVIWELSGLPRLMSAASEQILNRLGTPVLKKAATSAIAIATSQQAAKNVVVEGSEYSSDITMTEIRSAFARVEEESLARLDELISEIFSVYHHRADRAHANFIERATHSLLGHLERYGDEHVWECDPTGLRLLLRSAYSTMGHNARKAAQETYERSLVELAHVFYRGFGPAVEGIKIAVPEAPDIPPPVALGQAIALDFNDRWWSSWWRRARGYKAFAKQFRALISAETEDFMYQMKDVQTAEIRKSLVGELERFLEEQKTILDDLISGQHRQCGAERLFKSDEQARQERRLEAIVETLHQFTK